jgi:hypothetical protein
MRGWDEKAPPTRVSGAKSREEIPRRERDRSAPGHARILSAPRRAVNQPDVPGLKYRQSGRGPNRPVVPVARLAA